LAVAACRGITKSNAIHEPSIRPLDLSQVHPEAPPGSPAIRTRKTGIPAFSLDDAKEYVKNHPLRGRSNTGRSFTITRVEFMSSKQVSDLLHGESTGFPDGHTMCYVEIQGPITFSGPEGVALTYNGAVEVFDGETGNLLIVGGLGNARSSIAVE
jgi:hypothetical protein